MDVVQYRLFCLFENNPTAFPIDIVPSETLGELKKRIKNENPNSLNNVDAKDLKLWKVDKPSIKDINPGDLTKDISWTRFEKLIATPLDKHIHVYIRIQGK